MHTNRRYMPTKTLYRAATYPIACNCPALCVFVLLFALLAPKLEVSIFLRATFFPCTSGVLRDEAVIVRPAHKTNLAASARSGRQAQDMRHG